ncbi:MAG: hypothetical protein ACI87H_003241, partial [Gammaproteobacteria bacterium]
HSQTRYFKKAVNPYKETPMRYCQVNVNHALYEAKYPFSTTRNQRLRTTSLLLLRPQISKPDSTGCSTKSDGVRAVTKG